MLVDIAEGSQRNDVIATLYKSDFVVSPFGATGMKRRSGGSGIWYPEIIHGYVSQTMADDHEAWTSEHFSPTDDSFKKPAAIPHYVLPQYAIGQLRELLGTQSELSLYFEIPDEIPLYSVLEYISCLKTATDIPHVCHRCYHAGEHDAETGEKVGWCHGAWTLKCRIGDKTFQFCNICADRYARKPDLRAHQQMKVLEQNADTAAILSYFGAFFNCNCKEFLLQKVKNDREMKKIAWAQIETLFPYLTIRQNRDQEDEAPEVPMVGQTQTADPKARRHHPIYGMTEAEWMSENLLAVTHRTLIGELFLALSIPMFESRYVYPRMAVYSIIDTLMLWSAHLFSNDKDLGGEKTAYYSDDRRHFVRSGAQVPQLFATLINEGKLTMAQSINLMAFGSWGPGRDPDNPGSEFVPWDFDNPQEAIRQCSLVEWKRRVAEIKGTNLEEHVQKVTSESPNPHNWGHSAAMLRFMEHEEEEWSRHRRCGTVEARKERMMVLVSVEVARIVCLVDMFQVMPEYYAENWGCQTTCTR